MNTVYIINDQGGHDYSPALKFGELKNITSKSINRKAVSEMYRVCLDAFKDSEPGDFIIHGGPSILSSIAVATFASIHGRVNLLLYAYDKKQKENIYNVRTIVFKEAVDE